MFRIYEPVLLLDERKAERNLNRIMSKLNNTVEFRPHFKTHQSISFSRLYRDKGVEAITVSSMGMADYFMGEWKDITIAFPFNRYWTDRLNEMARFSNMKILVENVETITHLSNNLKEHVEIWIEVETGSGRTGVDPNNSSIINHMLNVIKLSKNMSFYGFYAHPGHTYRERNQKSVREVYAHVERIMSKLRENYIAEFPELKINIGDTPSSSVIDDFSRVDSVSCGNFIFYDVTQTQIGSCTFDDIAVCLGVPIVSVHRDKNIIAVQGGGIHLSKEWIEINGNKSFGIPVKIEKNRWSDPIPGGNVISISQEHGIIKLPTEEIDKLSPGDSIGILPIHSCMTAECMGFYRNSRGEYVDHFARKKLAIH